MVIDKVKTVQVLAVKLKVVLALGSANGWMFPLCNLDTCVGKAGGLRRVWRHGSMMDRCLWLLWHAWLPFAWHSWELHKMDFTFSLSFSLFLFISVCASLPLQSCACHSACMGATLESHFSHYLWGHGMELRSSGFAQMLIYMIRHRWAFLRNKAFVINSLL